MISTHSIPIDRFSYYPFQVEAASTNLLPPDQELVIDSTTGYSLVLARNRISHPIVNACQFSVEELPALLLLCEYWPSMVTYDLLATAQHPAPVSLIVAAQIEDAREAGTLEQLLAPLTTQIEGYRSRLQELGLDLTEVDGYGYRLVAREGEVQS